MRLYLSSVALGNGSTELLAMVGMNRRCGVIVNAEDHKAPDARAASLAGQVKMLQTIGFDTAELDLRDYFGRAAALRQALTELDILWVRGGNAFILRRAFHQSGLDAALPDLLRDDRLVYAGYSAGACVLATSLRGIDLMGDLHLVIPASYEPDVIWDGLGILPYQLAPHYNSDHPAAASVHAAVDYWIDHHIPFIALRDGEVLVWHGSAQYVIGLDVPST